MADYEIQLLAEMIDEAHRPTPIRQLPSGRRLKYHGAAVTKTRAKVEADLASGIVPVNRQHVRDALCDAALHILATDGDGADTIRQVLAEVFSHDQDAPEGLARKLKPRFFSRAAGN
ncbi:hypothetical protein [Shinella zoogloeoides]|uniref:hypothetical protein n=1 Tax=Shinella zoogloeoides TaxID=352475 RepID=UPI0028A9CB4D|nr:hypothetical protein [Shinella zoogloeoides]